MHETRGATAAPSIPDLAGRSAPPLRVLALAGADSGNGAGIQAARLHAALLRRGVDSRLLVKQRSTDTEGVEELRRSRLGRWALFHAQRIERKSGYQYLLHPSSPGAPFAQRLASADVLHVHNVHSGFVSPAALARWSRRLPVVWTLQDMWAFTGKCIYSYDCERWTTGCGACPQLRDWPVLERDRTDFLWRWKRRLWTDARFHLACPSEWLAALVRRSPLLRDHEVEVIPNSVDTEVFRPGSREELRRESGIPADIPVVAFGSHPATPRKGFAHLLAATSARRRAGTVLILAMGEPLEAARGEPGVLFTGPVPAGGPMARRLAATDLVCLPTLAENLALVLLEAAAVGLPVVAFDAGGTREAVLDGETGLLAPAGDVGALARALDTLLDDPLRRAAMGATARSRAVREFDDSIIAQRYERLYRRVVK